MMHGTEARIIRHIEMTRSNEEDEGNGNITHMKKKEKRSKDETKETSKTMSRDRK